MGSGRGTGRRATQASPPFFPATPAPTRRTRFPARFTKYLPLRDAGWTVATGDRLVGALCVVVEQESAGDFAHFLLRARPQDFQTLFTKRPMKPLNVGVLLCLPRWADPHPRYDTQERIAL